MENVNKFKAASFYGSMNLFFNKIIIKWISMLKNGDNTGGRKKVENYSYCLNHNIGKGYSSQVFKGRNDTTGRSLLIQMRR